MQSTKRGQTISTGTANRQSRNAAGRLRSCTIDLEGKSESTLPQSAKCGTLTPGGLEIMTGTAGGRLPGVSGEADVPQCANTASPVLRAGHQRIQLLIHHHHRTTSWQAKGLNESGQAPSPPSWAYKILEASFPFQEMLMQTSRAQLHPPRAQTFSAFLSRSFLMSLEKSTPLLNVLKCPLSYAVYFDSQWSREPQWKGLQVKGGCNYAATAVLEHASTRQCSSSAATIQTW